MISQLLIVCLLNLVRINQPIGHYYKPKRIYFHLPIWICIYSCTYPSLPILIITPWQPKHKTCAPCAKPNQKTCSFYPVDITCVSIALQRSIISIRKRGRFFVRFVWAKRGLTMTRLCVWGRCRRRTSVGKVVLTRDIQQSLTGPTTNKRTTRHPLPRANTPPPNLLLPPWQSTPAPNTPNPSPTTAYNATTIKSAPNACCSNPIVTTKSSPLRRPLFTSRRQSKK